MSNEAKVAELRARLTGQAATIVSLLGSETTAGIFLNLTVSLLALDRTNSAELAQFMRDLADEIELCERPVEPFKLN